MLSRNIDMLVATKHKCASTYGVYLHDRKCPSRKLSIVIFALTNNPDVTIYLTYTCIRPILLAFDRLQNNNIEEVFF